MNSKQKWRIILQRSQVQRLNKLWERWKMRKLQWIWQITGRSVDEFGKNWIESSEILKQWTGKSIRPNGRTVLVYEKQGIPEKYIRLVKNMYYQCETVVSWAAGTREPYSVEVCLHQWSAFSPFLTVCHHNRFTDENTRKDAPWQMMLEDGVVRKGERTHLGRWC